MATNSIAISHDCADNQLLPRVRWSFWAGFFFVLIFLMSGPLHFSKQEVAYAAAQGVPWPSILVPFSGVLAFAGGLSILLGYRAKLGAWLLVIFLIPVTIMMHNFWAVPRSDDGASPHGHVHEKYLHARRRPPELPSSAQAPSASTPAAPAKRNHKKRENQMRNQSEPSNLAAIKHRTPSINSFAKPARIPLGFPTPVPVELLRKIYEWRVSAPPAPTAHLPGSFFLPLQAPKRSSSQL